jgi:hypothetical protein
MTRQETLIRSWIDAHIDADATWKLSDLNAFLAKYGHPPATMDQVNRLMPSVAEVVARQAQEAAIATKQ